MEDNEVVKDLMVIERGLYEFLRNKATKMILLEERGVDNWVYYDAAMEDYRAMQESDPRQQELDLMAGAQLIAEQENDSV